MVVLLFGIAKDIVGRSELDLSSLEDRPKTVGELLGYINDSYPEFNKLTSLAVAVNGEYASNPAELGEGDEVALIPPVSGG